MPPLRGARSFAAVSGIAVALASFAAACDGSKSGTPPQRGPARVENGLQHEPDGSVHRVAVAACSPGHRNPPCSEKATEHRCRGSEDCTGGSHARCVMAHLYSEPRYGGTCFCSYSCSTDADCGPGRACLCQPGAPGQCADAACLTDADCTVGQCALSILEYAGENELALACRGPLDACHSDADCKEPGRPRCVYRKNEKKWACDEGRHMF